MPAWVRADVLNYADTGGLNPDGSLNYTVYYSSNQSNFPKVGISLEVMKFINKAAGDAKVLGARGLLSTHWRTATPPTDLTPQRQGPCLWHVQCLQGPESYKLFRRCPATGNDVTDANGEATFTYTSNGVAGSDTIRATIGDLSRTTSTRRG